MLEDQSPTLDAVIDVCLKWSRNEQRAETVLMSLAPGGAEATAEAGLAVVSETLKWGIKPERTSLATGRAVEERLRGARGAHRPADSRGATIAA